MRILRVLRILKIRDLTNFETANHFYFLFKQQHIKCNVCTD